MSALLDVGKQCTICDTVDFLPVFCPQCGKPFCGAHIQGHPCSHTAELTSRLPSLRFVGITRATCDLEGCGEPSLESSSDVGGSEKAQGLRCGGCQGAFCIVHRAQEAHHCTAPRFRDEHHVAAAQRKAFANDAITSAFPALVRRSIPKPPPAKDVVRAGATKREDPVAQKPDAVPVPPAKASASKVEKLRALSVRKVRSLAKPLNSKVSTDIEQRVYFTWEVDEMGAGLKSLLSGEGVEKEEVIGKRLNGKEKAEAVWAPENMSAGRVLELLAEQVGLANVHDPQNSTENLGLVSLSNPPLNVATTARKAIKLDLSKALGSQIEDCSRIIIVRGPLGDL